MTDQQPLRVGVIGLGWAGQQHMAAYAEAAEVDVVALAGMYWPELRRYGRLLPRTGPAARMPVFYERALRLMARRGLAPDAAETARQFASRVGEDAPDRAAAFDRLTGYYERARFGDVALSEAERQDVTRALAALGTRS